MAKVYQGNLKIENKKDDEILNGYEGINGDLSIDSQSKLNRLKSVGGNLSINTQVKLNRLKSVGGNLFIYSQAKLESSNLKSINGDLYIFTQVKLDNLKFIGGDLYIFSQISDKLEKQLWENNKKNKWYVCELCSEWLLSREGNFIYRIKDVEFSKEWFDKIRKDELTAEEVFAIDNIEHRRIAYEFMDKTKMKQLKDFKILDEQVDDQGNQMKIIQFTVQKMKEPLLFYNCLCPSSKREYFIETDKNTCRTAKNASFGFNEDVEWVEEW
jgi:predicted SprT family Zn-dependent metalloprotease